MWPMGNPCRLKRTKHAVVEDRRLRVELLEDRCLLNAGLLDPTFGTGGYTITPQPGMSLTASSLAIQSDGKIILAGTASSSPLSAGSQSGGPQGDLILARYNNDGTLDTGFGQGGLVSTSFVGEGFKIALDGNGKLLVGAELLTSSGYQFEIERFNADGSPDTTFGANGLRTFAPDSLAT